MNGDFPATLVSSQTLIRIIVTPIGGNGFIFDQGSKQFTPAVIRVVGRKNIIVVGARRKLKGLDCWRVDTGDFELDQMLAGYMRVTVSYREGIMVKVE